MVLKRVALTGASGMVGRHVLKELNQRKIKVSASSRTYPRNLPSLSTWKQWDLSEWKSPGQLDDIFGDVQALLHVGAVLPSGGESENKQMIDANVRACLCLGEWALQKKIPVVFLSGAAVYANPEKLKIDEDAPKGWNSSAHFYGFSKWLGEQVFECLSGQGLQVIVLRPSSIYGSGLSDKKMIANYLCQAKQGEPLLLKPPVTDRFNLIHARDVAFSMLQALNKRAWGAYNISEKKAYSIAEIASACVKVTGKKSKLKMPVVKKGHAIKERFSLSCKKARNAFAFTPRIDLLQGLQEMLQETGRL